MTTSMIVRLGLATGLIRHDRPATQSPGPAAVTRAAASPAANHTHQSQSAKASPAPTTAGSAPRAQAPAVSAASTAQSTTATASTAGSVAPQLQQSNPSPNTLSGQSERQDLGEAASVVQPTHLPPTSPPYRPVATQTAPQAVGASQPQPISQKTAKPPTGAVDVEGHGNLLPARVFGEGINTVFPVEAKFVGDLEIDEHFVLKGVFRGNITQSGSHSLLIGSTGGVHGDVRCHQLVAGGTIEGDVYANEVVVLETGKINGNVTYERLAVELGGQVNGKVQHAVSNVVAGQRANAQTESNPASEPVEAPEVRVKPVGMPASTQADFQEGATQLFGLRGVPPGLDDFDGFAYDKNTANDHRSQEFVA